MTLILDGEILDRDEGGTLNAGEVQWMTAGSGIIHSDDVRTKGKVRLLQLWLTLPKNKRWTAPGFKLLMSMRFLCATNSALRSKSIAVPPAGFTQARKTM